VSITRRIPRPSVALVVAFAALFAALGGTSYAALKITGSSIVNGTVSGADVKDKSLGAKEHKPDSLGGDQIKESKLATVPSAQHAATADSAQLAAKATDADTLGGNPASAFMVKQPRAFSAAIPVTANFPGGSGLAAISNLQPGVYVVAAKLTYDNDGAVASESCTLNVPGTNDSTAFIIDGTSTETIMLQQVVSSNASFNASVSCTGDGNDDTHGTGRIVATRLD
jgi:hypothetical protein